MAGLSRSAYQYRRQQQENGVKADKYAELRAWLRIFADNHRRWGYRRAFYTARAHGFDVGRDVIRKLWRQEGLRVMPRRQRKRTITGNHTPRVENATHPGHVWALDFQFDSDYRGRTLKICNVIDEFTRQHVGFRVARNITAADVIELLDVLSLQYGRPEVLRMDNGPEFIAKSLASWAAEESTMRAFIPPGQPWHNGFVESLHNRMRDELLEDNLFEGCADLVQALTIWSDRYNQHHPHSALGYLSPNQYCLTWQNNNQKITMNT